MTSDGINKRDWDRVHTAALRVTNATLRGDSPGHRRAQQALTAQLDRLEDKYGQIPSIVATRADFCDNPRQQVKLWTTAYSLADASADLRNLLLIATSLSEFYIYVKQDGDRGKVWLDRLGGHLDAGGADDRRAYHKLVKELKNLESECEQTARAYPPPAARQLRPHLPRRRFRAAQP